MFLERFHVSATGHSLNYLPEYIAERHGFFKEQGIKVTVTVPQPWDLVLEDLETKTAEAALGGIWVPSMYRGRSTDYTVFAQLSNRSPLALVARGSYDGFKLSDTVGRTVLMKSGNGASVGLFFKMLLSENGIDPNSVNFIQDLDGTMMRKLFQGGMGDYFVVDNVTARVMAHKDPGVSVAMEMVTDGGYIPWSVYYHQPSDVTPKTINLQTRFCAALEKGIQWVQHHKADTYRDELTELFPTVPGQILVDLVDLYREKGMWSSSVVNPEGYERWQHGLASGHLIDETISYDDIVNSAPSSNAYRVAR